MSEKRRTRLYTTAAICGAVIAALCVVLLMLGYGKIKIATNGNDDKTSQRFQTLVAVDPIAYLVERVGGDAVDVAVLTPPGKEPESFAPTPGQLADFAASRIFFRIGLPIEERFASNVASIANDLTTIDLAQDVERPDDESELDPHLWSSPALVRKMVASIAKALSEALPEKAETFQANATAFDEELESLQTETTERLASCAGRSFIVFHPAYGWYAKEFGLKQLAIESEGKAPRPRDLAKLIEEAKASGSRALIVQPEFNQSSAQAVANEIGGRLIVHTPLEKDYFVNIRSLTDAVVESASPEDAATTP